MLAIPLCKYNHANKRISVRHNPFYSFKNCMFRSEADHPLVFQYNTLENKVTNVNNFAISHKLNEIYYNKLVICSYATHYQESQADCNIFLLYL